jgi:hypothetical protein
MEKMQADFAVHEPDMGIIHSIQTGQAFGSIFVANG